MEFKSIEQLMGANKREMGANLIKGVHYIVQKGNKRKIIKAEYLRLLKKVMMTAFTKRKRQLKLLKDH